MLAPGSRIVDPARVSDELFPEIERGAEPSGAEGDPPRYQTPDRTQIELTPCDLEALLPPGHAARLVWRFVEGLDLSVLYGAIRAREGRPGRPPIDPRILVALWLYATIDGVGSAREVDRLCVRHDAYRWLRGGVSVNYHTLSDFRVAHEAVLDQLLTQSIAALRHKGVVTLARVAQDGTRIRASAGIGSFRREGTLRECLKEAEKLVARTKRQAASGLPRDEAAQARAAADRLARVEEALAELPVVAEAKARTAASGRKGARPREARTSTTDPQARIMKMSDGGFRPAYNVQFATDHDSDVIVGVAVATAGSDQQEWLPMLAQIETRVGEYPATMLVDGGFVAHEGVEQATRCGVRVVAPVPHRRGSTEPVPIQRGDSMPVALWRARMRQEAAQQEYRCRGAIAERINADVRTHRTLGRLLVRGRRKVSCWVLWVALAHNMMRAMEIVPHLMT